MVVGDAGAEDVDEREALVLDALLDQLGQVLLIGAEAARDEGGARGQRQRDGIDRRFDVAVGHALGLHADAAGGRGLPGGEAVDLVVHHDVDQVDVAAHGVHEVVAANAEAVAVAARDQHGHAVVGQLQAGGHRQRTAMQRVHAVGVDEAGKVRRAADAADRGDLVLGNLQLDQRLLHRSEHAEVAATRAPVGIDLALEIGHRSVGFGAATLICRHRCFSRV